MSMFEAGETPVAPEHVLDSVKQHRNGGIVAFVGSVRRFTSDGKTVRRVQCETDRDAAEEHLRLIGSEIRDRWQLQDVSLWHRLGRIEVGETISVVAVGAPHRQEAFEACQYAIDRIKEGIPLKEILDEP